jgi:hypothetical protein
MMIAPAAHSTVVICSMRKDRGSNLCARVAVVILFAGAVSAHAENTVPIHARLLTPLASYSNEGAVFQARVMGTFDAAIPSRVPAGTILKGVVSQAVSIGLGLKRERASLELTVTQCLMPDGGAFDCEAVLAAIVNARESVTKTGSVQGILAASHPHSWLGGVWYRPGAAWSGRSVSGLTGAGGKLQSVIAPSAIGAAIAVISRLLVFRLPNAEIELPPGTELIFDIEPGRLSLPAAALPQSALTQVPLALTSDMQSLLQHTPAEISHPDGSLTADIINIALIGSERRLREAFKAAGWSTADPLTPMTFARSYAAAAAMRSYAAAPVSPLHFGGRLPDAVYQKSLNSMAKRHHIRLWRIDTPEGPVWLGAATHDIAVAFEWKGMNLTHRIDPNIDVERERTLYDLKEAGCIAAATAVDRPQSMSDGDSAVVTDGALVVGRLRACASATQPVKPLKRPKHAFAKVIARRFVLEGRHYMTRGNAYYWAYRGIRWTFAPKKTTFAGKTRTPAPQDVKVLLTEGMEGTHKPSGTRPTS